MDLFSEDGDTQISITWNDQDQKRVEEDYCEGCDTKSLRLLIGGLVEKLIGKKPEVVFEKPEPKPEPKPELVFEKPERNWISKPNPKPKPEPKPEPEPQLGILGRVYFAYQKNALESGTIITPEGQEVIQKNYQWIAANPDDQVQLEGHSYQEATNEDNLRLGERRAKAVFDYLISWECF